MTTEQLAQEIYRRYGAVRRARGVYLYTEKGVRLTDCFLDGGRAIMGYGYGKARTQFKDTFERGANGGYASGFESRLVTAVRHLLPACYTTVRWYTDETVAGALGLRLVATDEGTALGAGGTPTAATPASQPTLELWRPFLDIVAAPASTANVAGYPAVTVGWPAPEDSYPDVIALVPPFSWAGLPTVYAFHERAVRGQLSAKRVAAQGAADRVTPVAGQGAANTSRIPASDRVAAPLLVAMARAFADLKSFLGTVGEAEFSAHLQRGHSPKFPAHTRALSPFFARTACYLFPRGQLLTGTPTGGHSTASYDRFVCAALDAGIVLSPTPQNPSIVPWRANPGDLKKLAAIASAGNPAPAVLSADPAPQAPASNGFVPQGGAR